MKKLLNTILILAFLLALCVPALAAYNGTVNPESVLLINVGTGEVLYEKESGAEVRPEAAANLMTALILIENSPLSNSCTVTSDALERITEGEYSTLVPMLRSGEQVSVHDLLYGLLLTSAADCANVLADCLDGSVDGSYDKCVELMNQKASKLGMTDTHFTAPSVSDDDSHTTTPADMVKLVKAALQNETLMEIAGTTDYTIPATALSGERHLTSSNRLLVSGEDLPGTAYLYATGMCADSSENSSCLVATAEKDGTQIACLIFGDESEGRQERWLLAKDMLRFGLGEKGVTNLAESSPDFPAPSSPTDNETLTEDPQGNVNVPVKNNDTAAPDQEEANETHEAASSDKSGSEKKHMPVWLKIILALILLLLIAFTALLLFTRIQSIRSHRARMQKEGRRVSKKRDYPGYIIGAVLAVFAVLFILVLSACGKKAEDVPLPEPEPEPAPVIDINSVHAAESTNPDNWGITWQIGREQNPGSGAADTELLDSYRREEAVSFPNNDYFKLKGIATFRGNNYRSSATYGTAEVTDELMYTGWTANTTSLGTWTGSGWTGQPLIVQWDTKTLAHMNIYDSKKEKENLTEVIYATLDGHIYFLDLEDGEPTRDPMELGMPFKGAGALDPRGYPIMYVGSGDEVDGKRPRALIINLLDCSVMMEFGHRETSFSLRTDHNNWCAFDSSPLVYGDGDLLIWPAESGILYTIKLNTNYNADAGTLSIQPEEAIKTRYNTARSGNETRWYGYEASAVIADHYLYVSENGGMFFCIDLNSMELVWAQETNDDSNSTPVYQAEANGKAYIYTAPSLHWTAKDGEGFTFIYKLDALTGEYVWVHSYPCYTVDGVSGGIQSSPLLGKPGTELEGMIVYTIARTPNVSDGLLVALDTQNGCEVWRTYMDNYAWSSPAAFYTEDGRAYIAVCDSVGNAFLYNAADGERLDSCDVGTLVEASPAIFEDKLVVGTRGMEIYMLHIE